MKVWYQSGLSFERFETYEKHLKEYLQTVAGKDVELFVNGTKRGGTGIEYRFTEYFFAREMIENGLKAEKEGFDAYIIGTTNDAGLYPTREVLNIPVIGITESSLHIACLMGRNFSLITPNRKMIPHYEELVSAYGLKDRLASIEYTAFRIPELGKIFEDPILHHKQVGQFTECAKKTIDSGAEVIVPIGGIVGLFLALSGLREIEGVTILDTIATAVKMAEMMVGLKLVTGTFVSRSLSFARPPDDILEQVKRDYGIA